MTATSTLYPTTVAGTTGSTWTTTSNATGSGTGTTSAAWAVFTNGASGGTGTISLSGYAAQTPVTSGSTINSVVLSLRGNVATTSRWTAASCTAQLFSATTAIGSPVAIGTLSTSTSNVWTISFTGANAPSYAQLADLRVTVTAVHSGATSSTFNVDTAGLVVNYTAPSKVDTLTDDFATADTAKWTFGAAAAVTGGQLSLGVNSSYSGAVGSVAAYDLTGSSATVQLAQAANLGNGTTETVFYLYTTPGNVNDNAVFFDVTGSGTATMFLATNRTVGGVRTLVAAPNYDPVAHRWLRIRESAGTVYWDTSPDQATWTNIGTWAPTFGITALYVQLGAGYYGTEPTPGTAIWDNFNTVPTSTVVVHDARSVTRASRPLLTQSSAITVRAARAVTRASGPKLTQQQPTLTIKAARSTTRASRPLLTQQQPTLIVKGTRSGTRASRPLLSQASALVVRSARSVTRAGRATLTQQSPLTVTGARAETRAGNVLLVVAGQVAVRDARAQTRASTPLLTQDTALTVHGTRSATRAQAVTLGPAATTLIVRDARAETRATVPALEQLQLLAVSGARAPTRASRALLTGTTAPTPPERTVTVPVDNRTAIVTVESRTHAVPAENRTLTVPADPRTVHVPATARALAAI